MRWQRRQGGATSRRGGTADKAHASLYVAGMKPSYRKPVSVLAIVVGLIIYAGLVSRLLGPVGTLAWYMAVPLYLLLGCLWLLPLKPLLQWMETGTWRAPQ